MNKNKKGKFTERVESELFGIIEGRTKYMRPLIITTNMDGEILAASITHDRAEPLLRRLREFCEVVVV